MHILHGGVAADRAGRGDLRGGARVFSQAGQEEGLRCVVGGSDLGYKGGLGQLHAVGPRGLLSHLKQKLRFLESDALEETDLRFVDLCVPHCDMGAGWQEQQKG